MLLRVGAIAACFLALTAFSDEEKTKLSAACADSLIKGKERGRSIPAALVDNRVAICGCIGDRVSKDKSVPDAEKPKITKVFELSAAGDSKAAIALRRTLDPSVNTAMRKYTRGCSRPYTKRPKTDGAKDPAKKGAKTE